MLKNPTIRISSKLFINTTPSKWLQERLISNSNQIRTTTKVLIIICRIIYTKLLKWKSPEKSVSWKNLSAI